MAASAVTPARWAAATLTPAGLGNLAALAGTTGWRVILGLNLGHTSPPALVDEAHAASSLLGFWLAGLALGNEHDRYTKPVPQPFRSALGSSPLRPHGWGFAQYVAEIGRLRAALRAAGVTAPLYGPDISFGPWLGAYAARERPGLAVLTEHFYPLNRCHEGRVLIPGPSIGSLLSDRTGLDESTRIAGLMRVAAAHGLPLRIDETNSIACSGQPHVSDTFAAALWAVDYSLMAARQGVVGLNFHGGVGPCAVGEAIVSPWYSPLCALPDGRLAARPEYYALVLLRSLEGGAFVRATYRAPAGIAVYALWAPDGTLRVVVDDRRMAATAGGPPPAPVRITLRTDRAYQRASVIRLSAPRIDATQGVTLGGAAVAPGGSMSRPAAEPVSGGSRSFGLRVTPASAAVVTLAG